MIGPNEIATHFSPLKARGSIVRPPKATVSIPNETVDLSWYMIVLVVFHGFWEGKKMSNGVRVRH